MAGDRSPAAERRRGIRRLLLNPRGEAASSSSPPPLPPAAEEGRRKGFASAALRGLGCTSAAASQAYAPGAAVRSSADWHGRRRRNGKERRKERGGGGGGGGGSGGGLVTGGIGADVWCAPGIPFAAEASSVDCVVARHQMVGRGGRGAEAERSHREVRHMAFLRVHPSLRRLVFRSAPTQVSLVREGFLVLGGWRAVDFSFSFSPMIFCLNFRIY